MENNHLVANKFEETFSLNVVKNFISKNKNGRDIQSGGVLYDSFEDAYNEMLLYINNEYINVDIKSFDDFMEEVDNNIENCLENDIVIICEFEGVKLGIYTRPITMPIWQIQRNPFTSSLAINKKPKFISLVEKLGSFMKEFQTIKNS